jgi:hypothetical protein
VQQAVDGLAESGCIHSLQFLAGSIRQQPEKPARAS